MIRAAITFFVIGLIAILFGAYNIAGVSIEVGKVLLFVFLALALLSLLVSVATGRRGRDLP